MQEAPPSASVSTRLLRIAQLAREAPKMAFANLAHHVDLDWMKEAFRRTRKDGAAGIDGQNAAQFAEDLDGNLQVLLNGMRTGWLAAAGIAAGPVFVGVDRLGRARHRKRLTDQVVRLVVKERARAAGLDHFEKLSGHSLRAGLATQAALNGANLRDIAKQTGHRSEKILSGYIRDADLWRNNVTEKLGR